KKIYFILIISLPLFSFAQELVTLNTQHVQELQGFKMYPNPVYGVEVYVTTATNGTKQIKIYHVFGEVVLTDRISTKTL
uniref:T9SS type A sorting domain-containing protein n=1 Tax=Flagellimonas flava TaxID=570519 RepID=UPI003D6525A7